MNDHPPSISRSPRRVRARVAILTGAAIAVVAALTASCAGLDDLVVLVTPDNDAAPPPFVPPDRPDASDAEPSALLCIGLECPAPYATCSPGDPSARAPFKCQHNLLTDNDNCGACGNACPAYLEFGMFGRCSNGVCEPQCENHRRDCNDQPDDGCETWVNLDPKNCGSCGNVCPEDSPCFDGVCGCPFGQTMCFGACRDLSVDDNNCGKCGNRCELPEDAGAPPPHMMYACSNGKCNELVCEGTWRNCNGLMDDGCEIDVERNIGDGRMDPEHCGGCDVKCEPHETCRRLLDGNLACRCKPNETMCPYYETYQCTDTTTDPNNCGLCGHACPFVDLRFRHQAATCVKGICGTDCEPGWGDCNDNPADGCETNLTYDGANCGGCGVRCNSGLGQPCVEGRCLTTECDAGDPVTR